MKKTMNEIILSKEELEQWLQEQVEKREYIQGHSLDREEIQKEVYSILFEEQQLQVDDMERMYLPFGQSGYWSARDKFELMVYVMEREFYNGALCFFESIGQEVDMSEEEVEELYYQWSMEGYLILSEDEKKDFFVQKLTDDMLFGVVEVLKRVSPEGFLLGEFCPPLYEEEPLSRRVAIYSRTGVIRLPFLETEEEELIRIIKGVVAKENKGELTMYDSLWECVREDGTCITAVRPPAGKNWGLRVLYAAAGRNRRWQS